MIVSSGGRFIAVVVLACLAGSVRAAAPATAREIESAAAAAARAECTVHIWPASDAHSSYMGWFHGGAVDGDRRGIKGYPELHSEVLTTAVQVEQLKQIDWPALLAMPNAAVVVHDQAPEPNDDASRVSPLIGDSQDCYEELFIHSVLVERAALSASTVRVMMIAKAWRDARAQPRTFSAMEVQRVDLSAPSEEQLRTSLTDSFRAAVGKILKAEFFRQQ